MSATLLIVIPDVRVDLTRLQDVLRVEYTVSGDATSLTVGVPGDGDKVFIVPVLDFIADGVYEDWPERYIPCGPASVFSLDYVNSDLTLGVAHMVSEHFYAIVDTNFGAVVPANLLTKEHLPEDLR